MAHALAKGALQDTPFELFEEDEGADLLPFDASAPYLYTENPIVFASWLRPLQQLTERVIALDTETTGLSASADRLILVQLYHPAFPPMMLDVRRADPLLAGLALKPILESDKWIMIAHNATFDWGFLKAHLGIEVRRTYCTRLAEQILTAGLFEDTDLATVAHKYLGVTLDKTLQKDWTTLGDAPLTNEHLAYAAADVQYLHALRRVQKEKLAERSLNRVAKLEFELIPAIAEAHLAGVQVDSEKWLQYLDEFEVEALSRERALQAELQKYHDIYQRKRFKVSSKPYEEALAKYEADADMRDAALKDLTATLKGGCTTASAWWRWARDNSDYKDEQLAMGLSPKQAQELERLYRKQHPPLKKPAAVKDLTGEPINIGSSDQLAGALRAMGVPMPTNRDTGNFITGKEDLALLAGDWPICQDILDFREVQTIRESFGLNVLSQADPLGRLHPVFKSIGAKSGRMSCERPNVQQIPGTTLGGKLRECFIAPEGKVFLDLDYSNIELRILAHIAGASGMIRSFEEKLDLHTMTAAGMFGHSYGDMMLVLGMAEPKGKDVQLQREYKSLRKVAKTINFGIPYGQTPAGFARHLGISLPEAEAYIKAYYKANPEVERWLDRNRDLSFLRGHAETLLGRKRFIVLEKQPSDMHTEEGQLWLRRRKSIARWANNHVIQGTSADITKMAIVMVRRALRDAGYERRARMIMFVHDEIVLECDEEIAEEVSALVADRMKAAAEYLITTVPIEVGVTAPSKYWKH